MLDLYTAALILVYYIVKDKMLAETKANRCK